MSRLQAIAASKRQDLEAAQRLVPPAAIRAEAQRQPPARDFQAAIAADGFAVIAEIKQASPAAGTISDHLDAAHLARQYVAGGARALAVWTDARFFRGSPVLLQQARGAVSVPVLRKDFILAPYQVYESRALGADAALLIAAILEEPALHQLIELGAELGMAMPVSVHREIDVDRAVAAGARIVLIHNRDVGTLEVDLETTRRLRPRVPPGILVVSESGIGTPADVARIRSYADAALVGTALMASATPSLVIQALYAAGRR